MDELISLVAVLSPHQSQSPPGQHELNVGSLGQPGVIGSTWGHWVYVGTLGQPGVIGSTWGQ